jgi:F0F1-type ATP synthase assembly protein I
MNRRDVLNIVLKVFGIQLLVEAFAYIPQLIASITMTIGNDSGGTISILINVIIALAVYLYAAYALIFRTEGILKWMLRGEEFDANEFATLKIHRATVLSVCIIVIGGLLVVNSLPNLIYNLWIIMFQNRNQPGSSSSRTFTYVIYDAVKILLGICMMSYQKIIVAWIDKRRRS